MSWLLVHTMGWSIFLNRTLKKSTSHTLSIAIIIISNQMINGIFIQPYRIICFCFDLTDKKKNEIIFFVLLPDRPKDKSSKGFIITRLQISKF